MLVPRDLKIKKTFWKIFSYFKKVRNWNLHEQFRPLLGGSKWQPIFQIWRYFFERCTPYGSRNNFPKLPAEKLHGYRKGFKKIIIINSLNSITLFQNQILKEYVLNSQNGKTSINHELFKTLCTLTHPIGESI